MPAESQSHSHDADVHGHGHPWNSEEYVAKWIAKDVGRPEREKLLDDMLAAAPFPRDAVIRVLDVGGGNGRVSEAVLRAFPKAKITMHDISQPMLDLAKKRFAARSDQMSYVLGDLRDPTWTKAVSGPFDLAVSGIAIHNLYDLSSVTDVYRAVHGLLKRGGMFLDCDHFHFCGGLEANIEALRKVGFARAEILGTEGKPTTVVARV
jgi:tRNA (cmo5U34)-methyltransferase